MTFLKICILIIIFYMDKGYPSMWDKDSSEKEAPSQTIMIKNSKADEGDKILIICQCFSNFFQKTLPEIDPINMFFIMEKKSKLSLLADKNPNIIWVEEYFNSGEVEYNAFKLYHQVPYKHIIIPSEWDILRAAKVRSLLKLEGQSYESSLAFRDKIYMKTILQEFKIEVPAFAIAENPSDILSFIKEHSLPVIIKPKRGYGSTRTQVLENLHDVEKFLNKPKIFDEFHQADLEIEKYINAEMYHIDGLVRDSKLISCWPSKYINTCLDMVAGRPTGGYLLEVNNPLVHIFTQYTKKVLDALPAPANFCFHLEIFYKNDKPIFCEIASRVGGPWINYLWIEGLGINLQKEFIRAQAFLPPLVKSLNLLPSKIIGGLIFPPSEGKVLSIPDKCILPGIIRYDTTIKINDILSCPKSMLDYIALFILEANSENEMALIMKNTTTWFQENLKVIKLSSPQLKIQD